MEEKYQRVSIVKIIKCSFHYMWYREKIGQTFHCVYDNSPTNLLSDITKTRVIDPIKIGPEKFIQGRIIEGDYEIIDSYTKKIE